MTWLMDFFEVFEKPLVAESVCEYLNIGGVEQQLHLKVLSVPLNECVFFLLRVQLFAVEVSTGFSKVWSKFIALTSLGS